MKRPLIILLLLAAGAAAQFPEPFDPLGAAGTSYAQQHFTAQAVPSNSSAAPVEVLHVAVVFEIPDGWVFYSPAPGGDEDFRPKPGRLSVETDAFEVVEILWPKDKEYQTDLGRKSVTNYVYKNRAVAYVRLRVPKDAQAGAREIKLRLEGQICREFCVDVSTEPSVQVTIGERSAPAEAWNEELQVGLNEAMPAEMLPKARQKESQSPAVLGGYDLLRIGAVGGLGLAILAGLILNVTPCVLPVIPIRILTVVDLAGKSRRRFVTLGLAFAAGIVLFFAALAVVNVILHVLTQQAFQWGRHFQNRFFRAGLGLLLVALAANLFGVFTVFVPRRVADMGAERRRGRRDHLTAAGMGLMLAIMSTPCSFAILMVALAWAQLQPLWLGTVSIVLLGAGMAFPHAVLAAFPSLVDKIPKPGRWTELLKEGIGFIILIVAVWLLGTLGRDSYPTWVGAYGVVLVLSLWMWGRWVRFDTPRLRKWIIRGVAVALALGAGYWMLTPPGGPTVKFQDYTPSRLAEARENGRGVLLKFTASWCGSCKWVDWTIYDDREVADELQRRNVLALEADVTNEDSPGGELIYDRLNQAPPLTLLYPPRHGPPVALVGKFSKKELFSALKAVEQAKQKPLKKD